MRYGADAAPFTDRVLAIVAAIPAGCVATYGDVAAIAGRPLAARAVGAIMGAAPRPGLPYHRVVASGGRLGGYGGHDEMKAGLLRAEGLIVRNRRIANFTACRWRASAPSSRRGRRRSV